VKVRAAASSDAVRLAELATQLGYPSTAQDMRRRLPELAGESHFVRVAEVDGQVAGWIHAAEVVLLDSDSYVEIKALIVDAEARGRRIGEALVDAAELWARERAHRFYARLGYEIQKTQRVFGKRLGS
jgi:GNAT superfamily N-acetyltransferase